VLHAPVLESFTAGLGRRPNALCWHHDVRSGGPELRSWIGTNITRLRLVEHLSRVYLLAIGARGRAISKRGFVASGLKAGQGGSDATDTAAAVVIVWPASSHVGDKQRSDKIALANSEMDALEQASIASQCSIRFQRPSKG
jgi:hypothetical protein